MMGFIRLTLRLRGAALFAASLSKRLLGKVAFRCDLAHNSVHSPEVEIGGTLANVSTVIGPFFDRFAEVEPNEDARIRILGRRLGEAGIRAEHWGRVAAGATGR